MASVWGLLASQYFNQPKVNMNKIQAVRYHDFCMGHRVVGHEGKCRNLHGHNYRITLHCEAPELDSLGRVIDFSVIKSILCEWIEEHWDHRMMLWNQDPHVNRIINVDTTIVVVSFNPTAENIAEHFLNEIAPKLFKGYDIELTKVELSETRKCSVIVEKQ